MVERRGQILGITALSMIVIGLGLLAFFAFYQSQVTPMTVGTADQERLFVRLTGLTDPASKNSLDPRYADADGDLVADAPAAVGQIDPPTLKFSYVAVEDDAEFRRAFEGLLAAISRATAKPVSYVTYATLDDELRALRDGDLHIAGLNTGSVPIGVCLAGFVPVAQMADADGVTGTQLQIIARPDAGINALQDLRGRDLTLTEPSSNTGYKAPLLLLRDWGLLPSKDYLIRYSQGQTQSIDGIRRKIFDCAAVASDVLKRETAAGRIGRDQYKVIYTARQVFPSAAIGYAYNLRPQIAAAIRQAVLNFDWKGTGLERAFAAEGRSKFVPADYKNDWADVRSIDERIGLNYALPGPAYVAPATRPTVAIGNVLGSNTAMVRAR